MAREADFPQPVRQAAMYRSALMCNKCRAYTCKAAPAGKGFVITGEAGHIRAASPGWTRYDENQPDEDRKSINNAIWLCRSCHKYVDARDSEVSSEQLLIWKRAAEAFVEQDEHVPLPPQIQIARSPATIPTDQAGRIEATTVPPDGYLLRVKNCSSRALFNIQLRIQWFERVNTVLVDSARSPTSEVKVFDGVTPLNPTLRGTGSIEFSASGPVSVWEVSVSELLPNASISIRLCLDPNKRKNAESQGDMIVCDQFFSVTQPATVDSSLEEPTLPGIAKSHIIGDYLYKSGSEYYPRKFFSLLKQPTDQAEPALNLKFPPPVQFEMHDENNQMFGLSAGHDGLAVIQGPPMFAMKSANGMKQLRPTIWIGSKPKPASPAPADSDSE